MIAKSELRWCSFSRSGRIPRISRVRSMSSQQANGHKPVPMARVCRTAARGSAAQFIAMKHPWAWASPNHCKITDRRKCKSTLQVPTTKLFHFRVFCSSFSHNHQAERRIGVGFGHLSLCYQELQSLARDTFDLDICSSCRPFLASKSYPTRSLSRDRTLNPRR